MYGLNIKTRLTCCQIWSVCRRRSYQDCLRTNSRIPQIVAVVTDLKPLIIIVAVKFEGSYAPVVNLPDCLTITRTQMLTQANSYIIAHKYDVNAFLALFILVYIYIYELMNVGNLLAHEESGGRAVHLCVRTRFFFRTFHMLFIHHQYMQYRTPGVTLWAISSLCHKWYTDISWTSIATLQFRTKICYLFGFRYVANR